MIPPPPALSKFQKKISWEKVDQKEILNHLKLCVREDLGTVGDVTTSACNIAGNGVAKLVSREEMIICGLPLIGLIFQAFGINSIKTEILRQDGEKITKGTTIAKLVGKQSEILLVERTILNFIQKLSGISTSTNVYASILKKKNVGLLDTRKTTPGLRILEKYATTCGGGFTHRMGLYDRVLIKDNHLASLGISSAKQFSAFLQRVKSQTADLILEVEIDSIEYLEPALIANVDAVLLDNFSPSEVHEAMTINQERAVIEASGGITLKNLKEFSEAHPHFISTGAPIHTSRWLDIGLDWE